MIGAVVVFHDVTKERRLKRALSWQASHDALTGLINRREFDNRLHAALLSAQRGEGSYALLYIDLDQFKVVNDTCGHQAGDRLLRDVTGLLQTRVRASDTIARLGGDEFGVLLEGCTLEQATRIAEGVRQAIRDFRFVWGGSTLSVGASIGLVQIRAETENVANVMSAADIACYAAKDAGRNRVHVYEADGVSHRHREMHWVARVTRAVEDNRLELFFQPIVPLGGRGRPRRGFHELTVRMRDDGGRARAAREFIPAAERYNVMSVARPLGGGARPSRCSPSAQRREPAAAAAAPSTSPGTSLDEQSFLDFVLQSVTDARASPGALCFEITETAAITKPRRRDALHERAQGDAAAASSLDDFGSGLSSFVYLKTCRSISSRSTASSSGSIAHGPGQSQHGRGDQQDRPRAGHRDRSPSASRRQRSSPSSSASASTTRRASIWRTRCRSRSCRAELRFAADLEGDEVLTGHHRDDLPFPEAIADRRGTDVAAGAE